MKLSFKLAESGVVPDVIVRQGIHAIDTAHLKKYRGKTPEALEEELHDLISHMKESPVAVSTDKANEQHYELPVEFFDLVLGKRKKYSCCLFKNRDEDLDSAEDAMFETTLERAGLEDGMKVLDLGCGWGSLTFYIAEKFPNCEITSVSNSSTQGEYIRNKAARSGYENIRVITADINEFNPDEKFDRVISIEMFEHIRNYQKLFKKISGWLNDGGKLFFHIFCHKEFATLFIAEDEDDWIAKFFFTGGLMPSKELPLFFQDHLKIENRWTINGTHYKKTADLWLKNMDSQKDQIMKVFKNTFSEETAATWFHRWRIFFMACSELWGYDHGKEWVVAHYLMV